jgi:hypothetical protein
MKPFVQWALDAAQRGDKKEAIELLIQNLMESPSDIQALLLLALLTDEPMRKRQVLNRVLSLDSTNPNARDILLQMDRDETSTELDKPLAFTDLGYWRGSIHIFMVMFVFGWLSLPTHNVLYSLPFLIIAFRMIQSAKFVQDVEVSSIGIRALGNFNHSEATWDEIVEIKFNFLKHRLELHKRNGDVVGVSQLVINYPRAIEIIHQRRPDLFGIAPQPAYGDTANINIASEQIYKKSFLSQYGFSLLMIPLCMFGIWLAVKSDQPVVGIGVILMGLFLMSMPLFFMNQITLDHNRLRVESFFAQKEYTAAEIARIRMKPVYSPLLESSRSLWIRDLFNVPIRYAVIIQPLKASYILLDDFPNTEIMYGALLNWWNAHRHQ